MHKITRNAVSVTYTCVAKPRNAFPAFPTSNPISGSNTPSSGLWRSSVLVCAVDNRMAHTISFSAGSDQRKLSDALQHLISPEGRWHLCEDGQGLERAIRFKTFKAAWTFMNDMASECKVHRHHPEWSNVYNQVFVRWTTHNPRGLSEKDIQMATLCDEFASRAQSLESTTDAGQDRQVLSAVANKAKEGFDDCCGARVLKQEE